MDEDLLAQAIAQVLQGGDEPKQERQRPSLFQRVVEPGLEAVRQTQRETQVKRDSLAREFSRLYFPPVEEREEIFFERLGQLHEADPETYPDPSNVEFRLMKQDNGDFLRLPVPKTSEGNFSIVRLQNFWGAVNADLDERAQQQIAELWSERQRNGFISDFRIAGESVRQSVGMLDRLIREVDPTAPVRQRVRQGAGEASSALGDLLRSGITGAREGAGRAGGALAQGGRDAAFLIEQLIGELLESDRPGTGNPRAVAGRRFAAESPVDAEFLFRLMEAEKAEPRRKARQPGTKASPRAQSAERFARSSRDVERADTRRRR